MRPSFNDEAVLKIQLIRSGCADDFAQASMLVADLGLDQLDLVEAIDRARRYVKLMDSGKSHGEALKTLGR